MTLTLIRPLLSRVYNFVKYKPAPILNTINLFNNQNIVRHSTLKTQIIKPLEDQTIDKKAEDAITKEIIKKVNELQVSSPERIFAVVQVCGKQFKITSGDVIIIEGYWPPDVGDKIKLEKVLLAGGVSFSLIGTPLVQPGLVTVNATVIEKNLSHTKTHFRKKRRKQYMRINFYRSQRTMLRINEIEVKRLDDNLDF